MQLNGASFYRRLLKSLWQTAATRPHYVQELRFILSLPLVEAPRTSGGAPLATSPPQLEEPRSGGGARSAGEGVTESGGPEPASAHGVPWSHYLQRPPSEMWAVDGDAIFLACKRDLRRALEGGLPHPSPTSPSRSGLSTSSASALPTAAVDVVKVIAAQQELTWLEQYLQRIQHDDTTRELAGILAVCEGSLSDEAQDLIPDSFFAGGAEDDAAHTSTSPAPSQPAAPGANKGASAPVDVHKHNEERKASGSSVRSNAVYSAGAVGLQREIFVYHTHDNAFASGEAFLRAFDTLDRDALARVGRNHRRELTELVRSSLPRRVINRNNDLTVVASVDRFDRPAGAIRADHAAIQRIAQQNLSLFKLTVEMTPNHALHHVQLVNTFFARYFVATAVEMNDAGLMPADAVKQLLQERDWGQEERLKLKKEAAYSMAKSAPRAAAAGTSASPSTVAGAMGSGATGDLEGRAANGYSFELLLADTEGGPVSLKGLLYYKVGTGEELLHEPIRVIPIGQLLMDS